MYCIAIVYFIILNMATSLATDEWECSVSHLGNWFGETNIEKNCEPYKDKIDQCCLSLDKCYDDQLGRRLCDDRLCDCLEGAVPNDDVCKYVHLPAFCDAARSYGQNAYEEAALMKEKMVAEVARVADDSENDSSNDSSSAAAITSKSIVLLMLVSFSRISLRCFELILE